LGLFWAFPIRKAKSQKFISGGVFFFSGLAFSPLFGAAAGALRARNADALPWAYRN
jgi:hypothetical protein